MDEIPSTNVKHPALPASTTAPTVGREPTFTPGPSGLPKLTETWQPQGEIQEPLTVPDLISGVQAPPPVHSLSRQHVIDFALEWMRAKYSVLLRTDPDRYHEMLGLLVDFSTDIFFKEGRAP